MTGEMPKISIDLSEEEAELFKEFCRQYELYTTVSRLVLDNPGGQVTLHVDKDGIVRKIQTSRTWMMIT